MKEFGLNDLLGKEPKDTIKNRWINIRQYDNINFKRHECIFYLIKSYICEWLKRERKERRGGGYDNYVNNIEVIPYRYGKIHHGQDGRMDWNETAVEFGLFKHWYIQSYNNGT